MLEFFQYSQKYKTNIYIIQAISFPCFCCHGHQFKFPCMYTTRNYNAQLLICTIFQLMQFTKTEF